MDPNIKNDRAAAQLEKLREILARVDALPRIDHRSEGEILGYEEKLPGTRPSFKDFLLGETPSLQDVDLTRHTSKPRDQDS
jgi:hypothetical protein